MQTGSTIINTPNNEAIIGTKKVIRRRAYARVSTKDQLKGFGLDVQESKIKDYIRLYGEEEDAQNLIMHVDGGLSGKNMKRTALRELLEDVKNDKVDEIIIYKLDRIARNVTDVYYIISLLIEHNCNLISVMDHLDIYTANGRLIVGILAVLSQWERETAAERTVDSTVEQLEEGMYPFGIAMFGYKRDGKKLIKEKKEATAYRFIVKCACEGMTAGDISKELKEEFGVNKRDTQIKELLERDYYADGNYVYKGNSYHIMEPLVTMEKLKLARKILKKRSHLIKNSRYYYRNKVRTINGDICLCRPTKKKNYHVYYYEHNGKRINQKYLDEQVLFRTMLYANEKNKTKENKKVRHQILRLEKKMTDAYNQYISGEIDAKIYGYTVQKLNDEIIKKKEEEYITSKDDMDLVKWQSLTDHQRSLYIERYIAMIVVDLDLNLVVSIKFK